MQFESTALYNQKFGANSVKEAALIATQRLAEEVGGEVQLIDTDIEGNYASCRVSVTTKQQVWRKCEKTEVDQTEERRFMVKPFSF